MNKCNVGTVSLLTTVFDYNFLCLLFRIFREKVLERNNYQTLDEE